MKHVKAVRALAAAGVVVGSIAGAGAVSAATPAPNLVVTAVTVAPGTVAGQPVRFAATVKNTGTAATPAGTIAGVGFQVDGRLVTWADRWTSPLSPGDSVTVSANSGPSGSATWTAVGGRHTVRAFVDDAGRIKESNEADNTLDKSIDVPAGLANRVQGQNVVTGLTPLNRPTVTATSVTGNVWAGCFSADGNLLAGTEQMHQSYTVGNERPALGSKWGTEGVVQLPAGAVQSRTRVPFSQLLYSYQGHYPLECATGTPGFTRFQVTSIRVNRFDGSFSTGVGAQIATVTTSVDTDLDVSL